MNAIRTCCLICLTLFFSASVSAVVMKEVTFNGTLADIKELYINSSLKHLSFLSVSHHSGYIELSSDKESYGVLRIKWPMKRQNIIVVQVPHQFFDLYTGDIAEQWFERENIDVLMMNTVHRYEHDNSDLSRIKQSLFSAFAQALIEAGVSGKIIQLHGFNNAKRHTKSAQYADFILSNGTPVPSSDTVRVQSCIRDNGQLLAKVYGRDVFELGATINPVGGLLNKAHNNQLQFLHVEMPRHIRKTMLNDQIPQEVSTCLLRQ